MKSLLHLLLFFSTPLFAQQIVFDMTAFGITFGKMTVTKSIKDDSTELYTLHAKGYLKVLWMERSDETKYEVIYRNGKLLSSKHAQIESGKTKRWTNVVFDGKQYAVDSYRGKRKFTEVPKFSVLKMYFAKPENIHTIFYEAESDFASVKKLNENSLEIKSSDGNRSIYNFKDGRVNNMVFHISIATVYMKKVG